jgi:phage baseplate assembly protein W
MASATARFGTDLQLLVNLQAQDDRHRGSDLQLRKRPETNQTDLQLLGEVGNLQQALLLRFLTPLGELAQLGHSDYGSRLFELIGELNNETNRNRAKLFVLLALAGEPRVKQVLDVTVTQNAALRDAIDISVTLKAIDSDTPLNLVFPFFLDGGSSK